MILPDRKLARRTGVPTLYLRHTLPPDPQLPQALTFRVTRRPLPGVNIMCRRSPNVRAVTKTIWRAESWLTMMPTDAFTTINDEDLANSIAYLKKHC